MTTSKLVGVLLLVASAFFLIQSPGWQFGYFVLSGSLAFIGLLLLVRVRSRRGREHGRARRSGLGARMTAKIPSRPVA